KAAKPPEMGFWTPAELHSFLTAVSDNSFAPMWRVLGLTGLRRGEVAALRWRDVDLIGDKDAPGRLSVTRQYKRDGNRQFVFSPPKSDQSRRTVDLDP